jgi:hypothetical protein
MKENMKPVVLRAKRVSRCGKDRARIVLKLQPLVKQEAQPQVLEPANSGGVLASASLLKMSSDAAA